MVGIVVLATAIANAESHDALARLAEQQAALRRIATLVARSMWQSLEPTGTRPDRSTHSVGGDSARRSASRECYDRGHAAPSAPSQTPCAHNPTRW
jgi:hypothetical protein